MEKSSYSQWGQDLWILRLFGKKRKGYFIECGAADGVHLSNTYLLEKKYNWHGLLIEPTEGAFTKLKNNRPNCFLENCCLASEKKMVNFFEVYDKGQNNENSFLSIIKDDLDLSDGESVNSKWGIFKKSYKKEAYPVADLLRKWKLPQTIEYFSLDVEGYEYEVLKNFPFAEYKILSMTIEGSDEKIETLLLKNGYRKLIKIAGDDLFVHKEINIMKRQYIVIIKTLEDLITEIKIRIHKIIHKN